MKKIVLLTSLCLATASFADELPTFDAIKTAILAGKSVHITWDMAKCTTDSKAPLLAMRVGSVTPNAFQVTDDHVAASNTHFTLNVPQYPDTPVMEFVRFTITDANMMVFSYQVLNPVNYTVMSPKYTFNCKLDNGARIFA